MFAVVKEKVQGYWSAGYGAVKEFNTYLRDTPWVPLLTRCFWTGMIACVVLFAPEGAIRQTIQHMLTDVLWPAFQYAAMGQIYLCIPFFLLYTLAVKRYGR